MKKILFFFVSIFSINIFSINLEKYDDISSFYDFRIINDILCHDNIIYAATNNGVIRFDTYSNKWLNPITKINGLSSSNISALKSDNWNVYFQTNDRWYRIDKSFENVREYSFSINENNDKELKNELQKYVNIEYIKDNNLNSYKITCMTFDNRRNYAYFGTYGGGLFRIDLNVYDITKISISSFFFEKLNFSYIGDKILNICEYDNNLVIFSQNNNENIINIMTPNDKWNYIHESSNRDMYYNEIFCLYPKDNYLFIGTDIGLIILEDLYRVKLIKTNFPVYSILSISNDVLYLGSIKGLYKFYFKTNNFEKIITSTPFNRKVNDIFYYDGNIFLATDYGIFLYNLTDYEINPIGNNITGNFPLKKIKKFKDSLFFGSNSEIYRLYNTNKEDDYFINTFIDASKIDSNEFYDMAFYKNFLFVLKEKKLYKYNLKNGNIINYDYFLLKPFDFFKNIVIFEDCIYICTQYSLIKIKSGVINE